MAERVIQRYFKKKETLDQVVSDFKFLTKMVNDSKGELSIQLREDYFNVYYKGNNLARVMPYRNRRYKIEIHKKFATGRAYEGLSQYSSEKPYKGRDETGDYIRFTVTADRLHPFLQKKHILGLCRNIEKGNFGEENTFEQVLITDNPPTETFIIIDRQVTHHHMGGLMDLLALIRDSTDHPFRFLIIEVKLGRNPELFEKVGEQLSSYVKHVEENIRDYIGCYKENYRQKKILNLLNDDLPDEIAIEECVEGLVVVSGYSQRAKEAIRHLRERWPSLKVQQIRNEIRQERMVEGQ